MLVTNAIRKGLFFLAVAIASICMMISVKSAQAADVKALVDRLERLERDIRTLNIQISRGRDAIGAKVPVSAGGVESLSSIDLRKCGSSKGTGGCPCSSMDVC